MTIYYERTLIAISLGLQNNICLKKGAKSSVESGSFAKYSIGQYLISVFLHEQIHISIT